MDLSIIIFCYNECGSIARVAEAAVQLAGQMSGTSEVIAVDDGSDDGTAEILSAYPNVRYIRHAHNMGIGAALRTGYAAAGCEYVCAVPGDGQFDLTELRQVTPFGFDTFYALYRPQIDYGPYRALLTRVNKFFNRHLLGLDMKDVNWIKVYRRDQLDFVRPELRSSIVESEICSKLQKAGIRPVELPSVYYSRTSGVAKGGSWKTLRKAISEMWTLYAVTERFARSIKIKNGGNDQPMAWMKEKI
ncbi:MAG: glycosyltransferase family 2 protein [Bacteroidetes bacterium]|nr:glycosyltransferase family 2 protein [Bacteroidota bacterium]